MKGSSDFPVHYGPDVKKRLDEKSRLISYLKGEIPDVNSCSLTPIEYNIGVSRDRQQTGQKQIGSMRNKRGRGSPGVVT